MKQGLDLSENRSRNSYLHEKGQVVNGGQNPTGESAQEEKRWHSPYDLRLVERYFKAEAHILILFRCGESPELVACLQFLDTGSGNRSEKELMEEQWGSRNDDPLINTRNGFVAWRSCASHRYGRDSEQEAVLVDDIEPMKLPSPVSPSLLVWLDTVENFVALLPQAWYSTLHHGRIRFGVIEDWEIRVISGLARSGHHKCISSIIKCASQIMDGIAQHKSQPFGNLGNGLDLVNEFSRGVIDITPERYAVLLPEKLLSSIEVIDVLFGPLVFC